MTNFNFAILLLVVAGVVGGYILGFGGRRHLCKVCYRKLPNLCQDGKCGGTPGMESPGETLDDVVERHMQRPTKEE